MATRYIYVVGAGRSGTTICSIFLQRFADTKLLGELNHLGAYAEGEIACVCGEPGQDCQLRKEVLAVLPDLASWRQYSSLAKREEAHSQFLKKLISPTAAPIYDHVNLGLVESFPDRVVIDSGKYVSRALQINRVLRGDVKFIWLTRDPRGVVFSFGKNVQSSRGTVSACVYYLSVNMMVLIASLGPLRGKISRVRYESMVQSPDTFLSHIGKFLGLPYSMPADDGEMRALTRPTHMIGGNRLVRNKEIYMRADEDWQHEMPRARQSLVWFLCAPLCLLFGYRL